MATASRALSRAFRTSTPLSAIPLTPTARLPVRRQVFLHGSRRSYSSEGPGPSSKRSNNNLLLGGAVAVALSVGVGYYFVNGADSPFKQSSVAQGQKGSTRFSPTKEDYQKVYDAVAEKLVEEGDYDDGSYGPVLLRLGWHASGTYDKETGTGGSNGATMRFAPERDHGANAGLVIAQQFLEPIKQQFSWITYSDLWTLAAVCAIQEMGGPDIPWRPGRSDRDVAYCTPDGRLPDASKNQDHLRNIFYRMGFNDQEIVALSGAHALGRCHADRSGYDGPWTFSPITLTNDFYKLLVEEKWDWKKWNGPKQYEDVKTKTLMMLPTDMVLIKDKSFKPWVNTYARDQDKFFDDFSKVATKLFELGVPFVSGEADRLVLKRTA